MSEQRDPQPTPPRRRASEHILVMLAAALLVLAVVPWIAASCLPRPLLPAAFAAERAAYETRVAVSQDATRTAQRHQDGEVAVTVIGAVEEDYQGEDPAASADPAADGDQAAGEDQTAGEVIDAAAESPVAADPQIPVNPAGTATRTPTVAGAGTAPAARDTKAAGTTGDPPLEPVAPLTASVTLTATATPAAAVTPTPTRSARRPTAGEASAAVRVLGTVTATLAATTPVTLTARVVVQTVDPTRTPTPTAPPPTIPAGGAEPGPRAPATSAPAAKTPAAKTPAVTTPAATTPAATTAATPAPTQPVRPGMVAVEDVIDAAALRDQLAADADSGGLALRDLTMRIAPDGLRARAQVQPLPLLWQPVEVAGTLAVINESLVFQVTSIRLNGRDVTGQYAAQLEDSVDSSLYRLLPQRFVQSFALEDGLVTVQSWVRRQ